MAKATKLITQYIIKIKEKDNSIIWVYFLILFVDINLFVEKAKVVYITQWELCWQISSCSIKYVCKTYF